MGMAINQKEKLEKQLAVITPLQEEAMEICKRRWDQIAKPLHSLGKLEDALIQIAGITGSHKISLKKKALVIMCADNGVVEEGVTQTGQEITAIVANNFLTNQACAKIMANQAGADVFPIDIGVAVDTNIIQRKISYGTKNFAKEPAMTMEEVIRAIEVGIDLVQELKEKGYEIICTGEMGIGNTTTSSAVASVLLGVDAGEVTGQGAGLSKQGVLHKTKVIERAIALHKPDATKPLDVVSKVGGLDIAGLTGIFLGGAIHHVPIVIDGFISSVAAYVAQCMHPLTSSYAIASHISKEMAGKHMLSALKKEPFLTCDMCLGEGTGAMALLPVLDLAVAVYEQMSTFCEIQMEDYKPFD